MNKTLPCLLAIALTASVSAEPVSLSGYEAFQARQKSTCGTTEEGVTRYGIFEGRTYTRIPGEKDRHIFDVLGINVRHCRVLEDKVRGKGFRSVSREIMIYMDPSTGDVINTWNNPWTGEDIEVMHVANDPVNMRAIQWQRDENGEPSASWSGKHNGDVIVSSAEVPLFYKNPLAGEFQEYVGGTYHAMEIFNTFYDSKKFLDTKIAAIGQSNLAWARVAKFLPWMKMGDRPGLNVFNASGFSTFDKNKIPAKLVKILDEQYPLYWTPPPLDDDRANETTWSVFKKLIESRASQSE